MSKYTDEELYQMLTETGRLLRGVEPGEGEAYSLEAILAEYGADGAEPEAVQEELPDPAPAAPAAAPQPEAKMDTQDLRRTVAAAMEQVMGGEPPRPQRQAPPEVIRNDREPPERVPSVFPEEPEGMRTVPLEQVMSETVESVLDEDDAILEPPLPLGDRLRDVLQAWRARLFPERRGTARGDGEPLWEEPEAAAEPEPDMEEAAREEKRLCKRLHRHTLLTAMPALAATVLAALDAVGMLDALWRDLPLLRGVLPGALLVLTALLAAPVWQEMTEQLRQGRPGCELAAAVTALVALADCAYSAVGSGTGRTPFAAPAAVLILLCQWGLLLRADTRRETFRLAELGGTPPYGVSVTAAGCCKQRGTLAGLYRGAERPDAARLWERFMVPMYLAAATVLAGVVSLSRGESGTLLWVWSALLTAGVPFALPLAGALPLRYLSRRLAKSGSAVAGYQGARAVSRSRRMVVTDDDVFPPGTVGMNGLKVYGEEIGKVVSYAASMTQAAHSQLAPLFEQLLTAEGGTHLTVQDLHYYEEGGIGGTIRGESVTMGSAYFMRKRHVSLPQELKLKTGVFLAVDGALIAIFAIKYQPSRNVEWALRAMRRNRVEPVLAARSCNVTPGLLRRRFELDAKPVYPNVSTRLALSDLSRETAEKPGAIIYRDGLMPFAEAVVGSRRMVRSVFLAAVLAYLGGLCGLLLTYYLTGTGAYTLLDPLRILLYQALWLLPTWLLSGLVKHY